MEPRVTNWLFGLITIGALAFAGFMYTSKIEQTNPLNLASPVPLLSPSPNLAATASTLPSAKPSTSPIPSSSSSPTSRKFSVSQALSLPNQMETIEAGGSLSTIAGEHGIRSTELAKLNGITDVNTVYAGQSIIVPDDVSGDVYTVLYVTNSARLDKEKTKITAGGTSLYADSVTTAQTDLKGLYGLAADTPYSKTEESETKATLSTSSEDKIVTINLEKDTSGLWAVKKVVIKAIKKASE